MTIRKPINLQYNNGGDGLDIARLLHRRFYEVHVVLVHMTHKSPDFEANLKRLPREIPVSTLDNNHPPDISKKSILIDAIFGSGLNREIEGQLGDYIQHLNQLENRSSFCHPVSQSLHKLWGKQSIHLDEPPPHPIIGDNMLFFHYGDS